MKSKTKQEKTERPNWKQEQKCALVAENLLASWGGKRREACQDQQEQVKRRYERNDGYIVPLAYSSGGMATVWWRGAAYGRITVLRKQNNMSSTYMWNSCWNMVWCMEKPQLKSPPNGRGWMPLWGGNARCRWLQGSWRQISSRNTTFVPRCFLQQRLCFRASPEIRSHTHTHPGYIPSVLFWERFRSFEQRVPPGKGLQQTGGLNHGKVTATNRRLKSWQSEFELTAISKEYVHQSLQSAPASMHRNYCQWLITFNDPLLTLWGPFLPTTCRTSKWRQGSRP